MSTIRVDNFGPSAGGTTYSADGIAKVWVSYVNVSTLTINKDLNVSSMTDTGVGRATINVTSAFADVQLLGAGESGVDSTATVATTVINSTNSTTAKDVGTQDVGNTGKDIYYSGAVIFGDLA